MRSIFNMFNYGRYFISLVTTQSIEQTINARKITIQGMQIHLHDIKTEEAALPSLLTDHFEEPAVDFCDFETDTGLFVPFESIDFDLDPVPMADSLRQAPDQDSPHNILNILCDDVLQYIFEDPSINSIQLAAIANVCSHFNSIAKDVFKKKYSKGITLHKVIPSNTPLWLLDEYFHTFGPLIPIIDAILPASYNSEIVLALIIKYCKNIVKLRVANEQVTMLLPIKCPKLINLHLLEPQLNDSSEAFFIQNSQLEVLYLYAPSSTFDIGMVLRHLCNLQTLFLQCLSRLRFDDASFFKHMQHLKTLNLNVSDKIVDRILNGILDGNVQLETLELHHYAGIASDHARFGQLTGLKTLDLKYCHVHHMTSIFNALVNGISKLERLCVDSFCSDANEILNFIAQMKSIKCLKADQIDDANLLRIIRDSKQLSELESENMYGISIKGIQAALKHSEHLKKVKIFCGDNAVSLDPSILDAINALRMKHSIDLTVVMITHRPEVRLNVYFIENHQNSQ